MDWWVMDFEDFEWAKSLVKEKKYKEKMRPS